MSNVLLSILAYTLTGLLYKLGAGNRQNALSVNTAVFGSGTAAALLLGFVLSNLVWDRQAVAIGVIAGLASVTANVTLLRAVRLGRLAVSWTIFSLAVVIPVCLAVLVWHEQVTPQRIAGVAATIVALILLGADRAGPTGDHSVQRGRGRAAWLCLIVAAFLAYGLLMSMNKMFEESGSRGSRFGYLSVCYGAGFLVSVILQARWLFGRRSVGKGGPALPSAPWPWFSAREECRHKQDRLTWPASTGARVCGGARRGLWESRPCFSVLS